MKAVLISIKPKWCELIDNGKKTVEVRKSKPKIDVPFKCYIYCTNDKHGWFNFAQKTRLDGKVIGEFICKGIMQPNDNLNLMSKLSCVPIDELIEYSNGKQLYGWRITDLVIYDKPKELSKFKKVGFMTEQQWLYNLYPNTHCHYEAWAKKFNITKPPQSYMLVEELR